MTTTASRSGPKTPAGQHASRQNAVQHGLTASKLLPEVLERDLIAARHARLCAEHLPAGPTEEFFVREMARHEAALERVEQIEVAVLRRTALAADDLLFAENDASVDQDAALAQAGASHALEKISRYRTSHERAFAKSLAGLRKAQQRRTESSDVPPVGAQVRTFHSEAECEAYLQERFTQEQIHCPRCQGRVGHWLAQRRKWQCQACRRQVSLRAETVMAQSRVKLLGWFGAIRILVGNPQASTAELVAATGIQREATVRRMAERIRTALASPERSRRLAGLDAVFRGAAA